MNLNRIRDLSFNFHQELIHVLDQLDKHFALNAQTIGRLYQKQTELEQRLQALEEGGDS